MLDKIIYDGVEYCVGDEVIVQASPFQIQWHEAFQPTTLDKEKGVYTAVIKQIEPETEEEWDDPDEDPPDGWVPETYPIEILIVYKRNDGIESAAWRYPWMLHPVRIYGKLAVSNALVKMYGAK